MSCFFRLLTGALGIVGIVAGTVRALSEPSAAIAILATSLGMILLAVFVDPQFDRSKIFEDVSGIRIDVYGVGRTEAWGSVSIPTSALKTGRTINVTGCDDLNGRAFDWTATVVMLDGREAVFQRGTCNP